jgi:hypothetical protein
MGHPRINPPGYQLLFLIHINHSFLITYKLITVLQLNGFYYIIYFKIKRMIMSARVSAKLLPLNPSNNLQSEGIVLDIGNSRFYFTHERNGVAMRHTEDEWRQHFKGKIEQIVNQLKDENPSFNPEETNSLEIDLAQRRVSYTPNSVSGAVSLGRQTLTTRKATRQIRELGRLFIERPGTASQPQSGFFQRIEGSYAQSGSPLGATSPAACTAIATEFAQRAFFFGDGDDLNTQLIDSTIMKGQVKFSKMRIDIERESQVAQLHDEPLHIDFGTLNLQPFPFLVRGQMVSGETSENFYQTNIDALANFPGNAVFGGLTNGRGDSFGVVVYKNDDGGIKEVVYFDSHSRPQYNGTRNACAMRFHTSEDAAKFLAERTPYERSDHPNWNEITMTPFYFNQELAQFLNLLEQEESDAEVLYASYTQLKRSSSPLANAIEYIVSVKKHDQPPSSRKGEQLIENDHTLLQGITPRDILDEITSVDNMEYPINQPRRLRSRLVDKDDDEALSVEI